LSGRLCGASEPRGEKIESSAEALQVCQHLIYLSLRNSTLQQHRMSNRADKTARNGKDMSLRKAFVAMKQSPTTWRSLRAFGVQNDK
jgi:hypothetical protein